jgi:quinol monooxygenase YgiN
LDAIVSLTGFIRAKKGCRGCDFCQSLQNENELCLIEEWDTLEELTVHLNSEHFSVLRGAMNLLKEPCEIIFHTVNRTEGGEI